MTVSAHYRALITRPTQDALRTAKALESLHVESLIEPLLTITPLQGIAQEWHKIDQSHLQGLIVTSANAIRAFAEQIESRNPLVFCVGPQSQEAAESLGFTKLIASEGDGFTLAHDIMDMYSPKQCGSFVYLAGKQTDGSLENILTSRGYQLHKICTYDATPKTDFSSAIRDGLQSNQIDWVLLYSARSAHIFLSLMRKYQLLPQLQHIHAFCLSQHIANVLWENAPWKAIHVAQKPSHDGMMQLIASFLNSYLGPLAKDSGVNDYLI